MTIGFSWLYRGRFYSITEEFRLITVMRHEGG